MNVKEVRLQKANLSVKFQNRAKMKVGHPAKSMRAPVSKGLAETPPMPVDWLKMPPATYPMDGNDTKGDCLEVAPCHGDNSMTLCATGTESKFALADILSQYEQLSGGDNGLAEGDILPAWKEQGLAGNSKAIIWDALDIDPTNIQLMQQAIYYFGGVVFMLAVPDAWYQNWTPGYTWDAPATADENNGHAVWGGAIDASGKMRGLTWGADFFITQAGIKVCDPSAFVVLSPRWFNDKGYAPNGLHVTVLASMWHEYGGIQIPQALIDAYPPPVSPVPPVPPTPPVPPVPTPGTATLAVNGSSTPVTVDAASTIAVDVKGGPGNAKDWFGLYPTGNPTATYIAWKYMSDTTTAPVAGKASGTVHFVMPSIPAGYEVRFYANDAYTLLATSAVVTVGSAPVPPVPVPTPSSGNVLTLASDLKAGSYPIGDSPVSNPLDGSPVVPADVSHQLQSDFTSFVHAMISKGGRAASVMPSDIARMPWRKVLAIIAAVVSFARAPITPASVEALVETIAAIVQGP